MGTGDELGQGFDIVLGARAPNGQSEKPQKLYVRHSVDFSTLPCQSQDKLHATSTLDQEKQHGMTQGIMTRSTQKRLCAGHKVFCETADVVDASGCAVFCGAELNAKEFWLEY